MIVSLVVFANPHRPYALRRASSCPNRTHESEIACLLEKEEHVRIVIPVVARTTTEDPCACTTYDSCVSNGVEVGPRCGCNDFLNDGTSFCYVRGDCFEAAPSQTFPGALFKTCVPPPSPPPSDVACSDPSFTDQWFHQHVDSLDAWRETRGNGTVVVIVDDGVQYRHPDLRIFEERSFGWEFETASRVSTANDDFSRHGTASAGIVGAVRDNGVGGCGVASDASLVAVKLLQNYKESGQDFYFSDDLLVSTFREFREDGATVLSNSWGPSDDRRIEGPAILPSYSRINTAMLSFGTQGRHNKGGVIVFAAGNGGPYDNANDDGFASHPYTFSVGAVGDDGRRTYYSEPGACIDVVAPSAGGWRSVSTTDIVGADGYSATNVTHTFGGTSAAAPMVSAVLALLMSVRPDLTFRDLKRIVHVTTVRNHPTDVHWVRNANGIHFNPWYGFGRIDAGAAVRTATTWSSLPDAQQMCTTDWSGFLPLTSETVVVSYPPMFAAMSYVDEVAVFVDIEHPRRGDVALVLVSPYATRSVLTFQIPNEVAMQTVEFVAHTYLSHAFLSEYSPKMGWTLEVRDATSRGRLLRTNLCVRGDVALSPPSPPTRPPPPPPATSDAADNTLVVSLRISSGLFACLSLGLCMCICLQRTRIGVARM